MLPSTAPPRPLAAAITAVRAVVLATAACVLAVAAAIGFSDDSMPHATTDESPIAWQEQQVVQMMQQYRCSDTGFGGDRIPASALVERHGQTRHVTFDHGWAVFTGEQVGTLVAVCLDDPPRGNGTG